MKNLTEGYTTKQAAVLAGVTCRQVNYWTCQGLIIASVQQSSRQGRIRIYGFSDIVMIRCVGRCRADGVSLQELRGVVAQLQNQTDKGLSSTVLVYDGADVYAVVGKQELLSLLKTPGQFAFRQVLDVSRFYHETKQAIRRLKEAS